MLFFPIKPSRHQQRKAQLKIRRDAMQNRDHSVHQTFIPRTQRVPKEQMMPQQPNEFAALLIQKLEAVKRERESEEKLLRIVAEVCSLKQVSSQTYIVLFIFIQLI